MTRFVGSAEYGGCRRETSLHCDRAWVTTSPRRCRFAPISRASRYSFSITASTSLSSSFTAHVRWPAHLRKWILADACPSASRISRANRKKNPGPLVTSPRVVWHNWRCRTRMWGDQGSSARCIAIQGPKPRQPKCRIPTSQKRLHHTRAART